MDNSFVSPFHSCSYSWEFPSFPGQTGPFLLRSTLKSKRCQRSYCCVAVLTPRVAKISANSLNSGLQSHMLKTSFTKWAQPVHDWLKVLTARNLSDSKSKPIFPSRLVVSPLIDVDVFRSVPPPQTLARMFDRVDLKNGANRDCCCLLFSLRSKTQRDPLPSCKKGYLYQTRKNMNELGNQAAEYAKHILFSNWP